MMMGGSIVHNSSYLSSEATQTDVRLEKLVDSAGATSCPRSTALGQPHHPSCNKTTFFTSAQGKIEQSDASTRHIVHQTNIVPITLPLQSNKKAIFESDDLLARASVTGPLAKSNIASRLSFQDKQTEKDVLEADCPSDQ